MPPKDKIKIDGLEEVYKALNALPAAMKGSVLRSVNRQAAKIVQAEMKSKAPAQSVKESIKIQADRSNKSGVMVGPSDYKARWFEYGTKIRQTRAGANRGVMNPEPFIEKAIDSKIDETAEFISKNLGQLVAKFLKRKLKRATIK